MSTLPCRHRRLRCAVALSLALLATPVLAGDPVKASAFYEDGLVRFEKGDMPGAVIQLKNALQQNDRMLSAHVLLGKALLNELELPAAAAAFEKALELGVSPAEIAAPRGKVLMGLGQSKKLLSEITADGLVGDALVEVLSLRAKAMAMEGRADEARAGFKMAIDTAPGSVRPYLDYVPFLIQSGDIKAADEVVANLKASVPDDARTWNLSASMKHVRGQVTAALAEYDRALELDPGLIDARVARVGLLIDLKRDQEALADLEYLSENTKGEPRSAYLRAVVYERLGDSKRARAALAEVANLVDGMSNEYRNANEQLLMLGAMANHGLGAREKAQEYLDALVRRFPQNVAARRLLASIYLDENDFVRAMSTLAPILDRTDRDAQANFLAGRGELGQRRFEKAKAYLEKAITALPENVDARYALALSHLGLGDRNAAVETLEQAVKLGPGRKDVVRALTTLYMQEGKAGRAGELVDALVARHPDDVEVLNLQAATRSAAGNMAGAEEVFKRILVISPDYDAATLNLAKIEAQSGRSAEATARLESLLKKRPDDPRAMFELGQIARTEGRLDQAILWFQKAVAKQPDQQQPALALIETLSVAGQAAPALTAAKEIGLRYPDDPVVQAVLGQAHLAAGDSKGAQRIFTNMTRMAAFDPDAQVRVGRLNLSAGFVDDAAYNVQKALTAREAYLPAMALMLDVALERQSLDEATKALESLRKVAPKHPDLPRYEGMVALLAGDEPKALAAFRQLYKADPSPMTAINLAIMQKRVGKIDSAEATLREMLSRAPSEHVLDALAVLLTERGNLKAARSTYLELLAMTPKDAERQRRFAVLLKQMENPDAEQVAARARALAPEDPLVLDTLGWIQLQNGKADTALALLRDARLRAPGNPTIRYHLAEALARGGRAGEAAAELRAALAGEAEFPEREAAEALKRKLGG